MIANPFKHQSSKRTEVKSAFWEAFIESIQTIPSFRYLLPRIFPLFIGWLQRPECTPMATLDQILDDWLKSFFHRIKVHICTKGRSACDGRCRIGLLLSFSSSWPLSNQLCAPLAYGLGRHCVFFSTLGSEAIYRCNNDQRLKYESQLSYSNYGDERWRVKRASGNDCQALHTYERTWEGLEGRRSGESCMESGIGVVCMVIEWIGAHRNGNRMGMDWKERKGRAEEWECTVE